MILYQLATLLGSATYVLVSTCAWYATEARNPHMAAALDAGLDALEWVFIILLIKVSMWLAVSSVVGTYAGSYLGVKLGPALTARFSRRARTSDSAVPPICK